MSFLSYIFPREIYKGSSKFSSDIRVIEDAGSLRLLVNGIEQSGKYIDKILKRALDECEFPSNASVKRMLLLGVGGGSLILFFRKRYPEITIDAVDIDPVIIEVAKTYFKLSEIEKLTFHVSDAHECMKEIAKTKHETYGIVVVDLYIGRDIPEFVWKKEFFKEIRSLLVPGGLVFFNVVHDGAYENRVKKMNHTLRSLFSKLQEIPIDYNTFFLATA
jgi:spermidine synthase